MSMAQEIHECGRCGAEWSKEDATLIQGSYYCPDCNYRNHIGYTAN